MNHRAQPSQSKREEIVILFLLSLPNYGCADTEIPESFLQALGGSARPSATSKFELAKRDKNVTIKTGLNSAAE